MKDLTDEELLKLREVFFSKHEKGEAINLFEFEELIIELESRTDK